jgi:hypothetical protein
MTRRAHILALFVTCALAAAACSDRARSGERTASAKSVLAGEKSAGGKLGAGHGGEQNLAVAVSGIWIGPAEIAQLPMQGPCWDSLLQEAQAPAGKPDLSDQEEKVHQRVLAKALVFARTGDTKLRFEVIDAVLGAMGTERGARTLAVGRNVIAYVIAADLVHLPPDEDARFRDWLRDLLDEKLHGKSLRSTHMERPNNWGQHAGASRAAIAVYLGDRDELEQTARVFKGWLGDRSSWTEFEYGDYSWQADREHPVGINPAGATRDGHSIDGVLPDDQRRAGPYTWPPPHENYVYGALQGAMAQAVILSRAGYDVWQWQDKALLRAFTWLQREAQYPPDGDDVWLLPLVDHFYGTHFWDGTPTLPGKNMGWTDWTHGRRSE